MHHVAIVVYPGFELLDVSGPASVFNVANRSLAQRGGSKFYNINLFWANGGTVASSSGVALATRRIAQLRPAEAQTLLIAGAEGEHLRPALAEFDLAGRRFRDWRRKPSGSALSAVADFFSPHLDWSTAVASRRTGMRRYLALAGNYPEVEVDPDALYVVDGRLWTSAGVTTGIDMTLAMVARDFDATIAGEVAERLVLYARRPGYQSQFSPVLQAQLKAESPFADLIAWILSHLDEPLDVPSLAARARLTERSFHRKFVAATGETPAILWKLPGLTQRACCCRAGLSLKSVAAKVGLFPPARFSRKPSSAASASHQRYSVTCTPTCN